MNHDELTKISNDLINGQYVFETEEYSNAINSLIQIDVLPDAINILEQLANSNHFANIFAASFILENCTIDFIDKNKSSIYSIIKIISDKKYFRANFYIIKVLICILQEDKDYRLYLNFIYSDNEIESNQAISQLVYFDNKDLEILDTVSELYDFSIFWNVPDDVNKAWFSKITHNTSLTYKKIVSVAIYRKFLSKEFVFSLSDEKDPNLFDFIFFLPDSSLDSLSF